MSKMNLTMLGDPSNIQSAMKAALQTCKREMQHQQDPEQQEGPSAAAIKAGSNSAAVAAVAARGVQLPQPDCPQVQGRPGRQPADASADLGHVPTTAAEQAAEQVWAKVRAIGLRCMSSDATMDDAQEGLDLIRDFETRYPCYAAEIGLGNAAGQLDQACSPQRSRAAVAASTQDTAAFGAAAAADAMAAKLIAEEDEAAAKKQTKREAAAAAAKAAKQNRQGERKKQQQPAGKQQPIGDQLQHSSKLDSKATAAASEEGEGAREGDKDHRGSGPVRLGACGSQGQQLQQLTGEEGHKHAASKTEGCRDKNVCSNRPAPPPPAIPRARARTSSTGSSSRGTGDTSEEILSSAKETLLMSQEYGGMCGDANSSQSATKAALQTCKREMQHQQEVEQQEGPSASTKKAGSNPAAAAAEAAWGKHLPHSDCPQVQGRQPADAEADWGKVPTTEAASAEAAETRELIWKLSSTSTQEEMMGAMEAIRQRYKLGDATMSETRTHLNIIKGLQKLQSPRACNVPHKHFVLTAYKQDPAESEAAAAAADAMAAKLIAEEEEAAAKKQAKQGAAAKAGKLKRQEEHNKQKQQQQQAGKQQLKGGKLQHSSKPGSRVAGADSEKGTGARDADRNHRGGGAGRLGVCGSQGQGQQLLSGEEHHKHAASNKKCFQDKDVCSNLPAPPPPSILKAKARISSSSGLVDTGAAAPEPLSPVSSSSAGHLLDQPPEGQAGDFQTSRAAGVLGSAEGLGIMSSRIAGAEEVHQGIEQGTAAAPALAMGAGSRAVSRRSPLGVGQGGVAGAADVRVAGEDAAKTAIGDEKLLTAQLPAAIAGGGSSVPQHQQQQPSGKNRRPQKDGSHREQQLQQVGMKKSPGKATKRPSPCVVCWESTPCVVLLPCKHLVLCEACSKMMEGKGAECPMCRATVEQHMMIYSA